MEYIIVTVAGQPHVQADVLINRQKNGKTDSLLMLGDPGWVFVSVDLPNAQEQKVQVKNTTPNHPMTVKIQCG
jgi:hypothetical protein